MTWGRSRLAGWHRCRIGSRRVGGLGCLGWISARLGGRFVRGSGTDGEVGASLEGFP